MVLAFLNRDDDLDLARRVARDQVAVLVDGCAGGCRALRIDRICHFAFGAFHKFIQIDAVVVIRKGIDRNFVVFAVRGDRRGIFRRIDGEGSGHVFYRVIALLGISARSDGVSAGILTALTAYRVADETLVIPVRKAFHRCFKGGRIVPTVVLGVILGRYRHFSACNCKRCRSCCAAVLKGLGYRRAHNVIAGLCRNPVRILRIVGAHLLIAVRHIAFAYVGIAEARQICSVAVGPAFHRNFRNEGILRRNRHRDILGAADMVLGIFDGHLDNACSVCVSCGKDVLVQRTSGLILFGNDLEGNLALGILHKGRKIQRMLFLYACLGGYHCRIVHCLDGQRSGLVCHFVVALNRIAGRRQGVFADIIALFAIDCIGNRIAVLYARNLSGVKRICRAVVLGEILRLYGRLGSCNRKFIRCNRFLMILGLCNGYAHDVVACIRRLLCRVVVIVLAGFLVLDSHGVIVCRSAHLRGRKRLSVGATIHIDGNRNRILRHHLHDDGLALAGMVFTVGNRHDDCDLTLRVSRNQVSVLIDDCSGSRRAIRINLKCYIALGAIHKIVQIDAVVIVRKRVDRHFVVLAVRGDRCGILRRVDLERSGLVGYIVVALYGISARSKHVGADLFALCAGYGVLNAALVIVSYKSVNLYGKFIRIVSFVILGIILGGYRHRCAIDGEFLFRIAALVVVRLSELCICDVVSGILRRLGKLRRRAVVIYFEVCNCNIGAVRHSCYFRLHSLSVVGLGRIRKLQGYRIFRLNKNRNLCLSGLVVVITGNRHFNRYRSGILAGNKLAGIRIHGAAVVFAHDCVGHLAVCILYIFREVNGLAVTNHVGCRCYRRAVLCLFNRELRRCRSLLIIVRLRNRRGDAVLAGILRLFYRLICAGCIFLFVGVGYFAVSGVAARRELRRVGRLVVGPAVNGNRRRNLCLFNGKRSLRRSAAVLLRLFHRDTYDVLAGIRRNFACERINVIVLSSVFDNYLVAVVIARDNRCRHRLIAVGPALLSYGKINGLLVIHGNLDVVLLRLVILISGSRHLDGDGSDFIGCLQRSVLAYGASEILVNNPVADLAVSIFIVVREIQRLSTGHTLRGNRHGQAVLRLCDGKFRRLRNAVVFAVFLRGHANHIVAGVRGNRRCVGIVRRARLLIANRRNLNSIRRLYARGCHHRRYRRIADRPPFLAHRKRRISLANREGVGYGYGFVMVCRADGIPHNIVARFCRNVRGIMTITLT